MLAEPEQANGQEATSSTRLHTTESPQQQQQQQHQSTMLVADVCIKRCYPPPSLASESSSSVEQVSAPTTATTITDDQLESGEFVPFAMSDQEVDCGWPMACDDELNIHERRGRRDSSLMCETLDQGHGELEREDPADLNQYFSTVYGGSLYDFPHQSMQQFDSGQDGTALSQQDHPQDHHQQVPLIDHQVDIDQHQHQHHHHHHNHHHQQHNHHQQPQHQQPQQQQQQQQHHQQYQWRHESFHQQVDYQPDQNHIDDYQRHHYPPIKCRDNELGLKVDHYYDYQASTSTGTTDLDINNNNTTTAFATSRSHPIRDRSNNHNDNQYLATNEVRCYQPAGVAKFDSGRQLIEYRPHGADSQHLSSYQEQQVYGGQQLHSASYVDPAQSQPQMTYHQGEQPPEQPHYHQHSSYQDPMEEESAGKTYHLLGQQSSSRSGQDGLPAGGSHLDVSESLCETSSIPRVSKLYDPTQELTKCLMESGGDLFESRADEDEPEMEEDDEGWSQVSAELSSTASSHEDTWTSESRKGPLSGRSSSQSFASRSGAGSRASRSGASSAMAGDRPPGCRPETLRKLRQLLESRRVVRPEFPRPSGSRQSLAKPVVAQVVEPPSVVLVEPEARPLTRSPPTCAGVITSATSTCGELSEGRQLRSRVASSSASETNATAERGCYGIETRASKRRRNNDEPNPNNQASSNSSPASSRSSSVGSSQASLFQATCRLEPTTRSGTTRQSFSGSNSLAASRSYRLTRSNSSESRAAIAFDTAVAGRNSSLE